MLDRLWQKTKRIALGAFGFIVMVLVVMVLSPEADAKADYFGLKTNIKRTGKVVKEDAVEDGSIVSVVENGDFRITLMTDASEYHSGDPINIKTVVEYIGSKSEVELSSCDPVVSFRIEGSNGIQGDTYAYYNKKALVKTVFKKGEKYEFPFIVDEYTGFYGNNREIFAREDPADFSGDEYILHLPKGTYTIVTVLTSELLNKKPVTFYAEMHLNIDVEGDVFYSGSNLYRTLGDNEAVLIGTKIDNPNIYVGAIEKGVNALEIPSSVKYNGKTYKVTVIGDEGIKYSTWVDDYVYSEVTYGTFTAKAFSKVKIPSSVRKINSAAFTRAIISSIYIEAEDLDIGEKAFYASGYWSEAGTLTIKGGNVNIEKMGFDYSCLKDVDLSSVKSLTIGELAFAELYPLKTIKLPENIVSIGHKAFYDSAELRDKVTITIPKGTEKIEGPVANKMIIKVAEGNVAFVDRYGLLLTVDGSTVLGISDFRVTEIAMPEGVTTIMPYAFTGTRIKKLVIPDTVEVIPEYMAMNTPYLKSVKLGKNVKSIGDYAFCATKLKKITLPKGLKSIGSNAFEGSKLKKVTIPNTVESIGNCAFRNNDSNIKITFKKKNKTFKQSGIYLFKPGTKTVIGLASNSVPEYDFEKLDLQYVITGSVYGFFIPGNCKEVDISSFSSKVMGSYESGNGKVYEAAEVIFRSPEPPRFVDERNSEKEFFIWIFLPEDGDRDAYKAALEEVGLEDGKNFIISDRPYISEWDF